eukprot:6202000-Pleurochrysis_carterae.AAC.4
MGLDRAERDGRVARAVGDEPAAAVDDEGGREPFLVPRHRAHRRPRQQRQRRALEHVHAARHQPHL